MDHGRPAENFQKTQQILSMWALPLGFGAPRAHNAPEASSPVAEGFNPADPAAEVNEEEETTMDDSSGPAPRIEREDILTILRDHQADSDMEGDDGDVMARGEMVAKRRILPGARQIGRDLV